MDVLLVEIPILNGRLDGHVLEIALPGHIFRVALCRIPEPGALLPSGVLQAHPHRMFNASFSGGIQIGLGIVPGDGLPCAAGLQGFDGIAWNGLDGSSIGSDPVDPYPAEGAYVASPASIGVLEDGKLVAERTENSG